MKRIVWFILIFASAPVYAGSTQITLDEAVTTALLQNRELAAAGKRAEQTKEKVTQAWGSLLPVIESQGSASRQYAESGILALSDGAYDVRAVQVTFGVNPGATYHAVKIASEENAGAREEIRRIRYQVTSDVIQAYFSIVRARQILAIRKDSLSQLRSNYRDVSNLYKNGSVSRFDLLQSEVQLKSAEPLVLEAETLLAVSLDAFNLTLGSRSGTYEPAANPEHPPAFRMPEDDAKILATLTQTAMKNRPEIVQLDLRRQQAGHAAAAQESLWFWPTFSIGGNYGWNRSLANSPSIQGNPAMAGALSSVFGGDSWQNTWQIRAGATYRWDTLLPFSSAHAKKREADAAAEELHITLAQIKQSVEVAVRKDYYSFKTALITISARTENIITAEEGLRIARESYREGIVRNSELLAAESALTAARGAYTDALYTCYASMANLQRDTGVDSLQIFFAEEQK
jgi:outer membrane protein TolC